MTEVLAGLALITVFCMAASLLMVFAGVFVCELFGCDVPSWYRDVAFRLAMAGLTLTFLLLTGGTVTGLAVLVMK